MDGTCDVNECTNETFMGWRPLTEPKGKQICEVHFRRHDDPNDSFNLWDAFGFKRPANHGRPNQPVRKEHKPYDCSRALAYLRDILDRVSTHPANRIGELTPSGWKKCLRIRN